ncbi:MULTISPECIES: hypothetical protein [Streptomyces]|uniref:hypothetical protein n=1 Tax=Streptomyces TaxID=1883 RepID=UPI0004C5BBBA|nr:MULTISPECIES: hypothetical protein [Streptomyces]
MLLGPSPIEVPTVADRFGEEFQSRRRLAAAFAWAAVGASWCDTVLMGPSVIVQDTPDAMRFLNDHLRACAADPDDVTTYSSP